MTDATPVISEALIKYLESRFPNKCPELTETLEEIRFSSGQRSVVNHLIELFNEQSENVLKS